MKVTSCRFLSTSDFWNRSASLKRSEEHTSELQSQSNLVCRLLLEKKKKNKKTKNDQKKQKTITKNTRDHTISIASNSTSDTNKSVTRISIKHYTYTRHSHTQHNLL